MSRLCPVSQTARLPAIMLGFLVEGHILLLDIIMYSATEQESKTFDLQSKQKYGIVVY